MCGAADLPAGDELERAAMEKLRTWASFLDPDQAHSALVAKLALQLYDGISQCGILQFAEFSPQDSGRRPQFCTRSGEARQKNGGHQKRGYRMVGKLKPPSAGPKRICDAVAAMVRHHRGALPVTGRLLVCGTYSKAAFRVAGADRNAAAGECLRRRRTSTGNGSQCGGAEMAALLVSARGLEEFGPVAQRVAQARYLLESICKRPIMVRAVSAQPVLTPASSRDSQAVCRGGPLKWV